MTKPSLQELQIRQPRTRVWKIFGLELRIPLPWIKFRFITVSSLAYTYKLQREVDDNNSAGTSSTENGGDLTGISGFYEWHGSSVFLIGALELQSITSTTTKTNGSESSTDSKTVTGFRLLGGYYFTPDFAGALSFSNVSVPEQTASSTVKVGSYSATSVDAAVRLEF